MYDECARNAHRRGYLCRVHRECEGNRMATPVFEEFDPASDCECPGCVLRRRTSTPTVSSGQYTGRHEGHHTVVVAAATAATAAALGALPVAPALAAPHAPVRPGVPAADEPE